MPVDPQRARAVRRRIERVDLALCLLIIGWAAHCVGAPYAVMVAAAAAALWLALA